MATETEPTVMVGDTTHFEVSCRGLAWGTQANRCHAHFGLKSAPRHRDFRPGKVGIDK